MNTFIGMLIHKKKGRGLGNGGGGIVILARWEIYFFREHENLVQHPSINKSIIVKKVFLENIAKIYARDEMYS